MKEWKQKRRRKKRPNNGQVQSLRHPLGLAQVAAKRVLIRQAGLELNYYTNMSDFSHCDKPLYYNGLPQKSLNINYAVFSGQLRLFMQFLAVLAYLFYILS